MTLDLTPKFRTEAVGYLSTGLYADLSDDRRFGSYSYAVFGPVEFDKKLKQGAFVLVEGEYIRLDVRDVGFKLLRGCLGTKVEAHPPGTTVELCGPPVWEREIEISQTIKELAQKAMEKEKAVSATERPKQRRGFAAMDPEKQRAIAIKGGNTVSRDREHMAEIGAKGGRQRGKNRKQEIHLDPFEWEAQ